MRQRVCGDDEARHFQAFGQRGEGPSERIAEDHVRIATGLPDFVEERGEEGAEIRVDEAREPLRVGHAIPQRGACGPADEQGGRAREAVEGHPGVVGQFGEVVVRGDPDLMAGPAHPGGQGDQRLDVTPITESQEHHPHRGTYRLVPS